MAFTLIDAMKISTVRVKAGIVKNIIETSAVMSQMNIKSTDGETDYKYSIEGALPNTSSRAFNAPFTTQTKGEFETGSQKLKIVGQSIDMDRQMQNQRDVGGMNLLGRQLSMKARAIGLDIKKLSVKGNSSVTSTDPDGLEVLVSKFPGQTIAFKDAANGSSLVAATPTEIITNMNNLINTTKGTGIPDFIMCKQAHLDTINARTVTGNNSALASYFAWDEITLPGVMGSMKVRVGRWGTGGGVNAQSRGIMMFPVDWDSQRAEIIDFDETKGSSSEASSMYAIKTGDDFFSMLLKSTNIDQAINIFKIPNTSGDQFDAELMVGFVIEHENSVGRLSGILA